MTIENKGQTIPQLLSTASANIEDITFNPGDDDRFQQIGSKAELQSYVWKELKF